MLGQHVLEATDGAVIGCFSLPKYESAAYVISAEILDFTASEDSFAVAEKNNFEKGNRVENWLSSFKGVRA